MSSKSIHQLGAIAFLAAGFGMVSHHASAQEVCGVTSDLFRDGFEEGSLPPFSLPGDSTPLALAVTSPPNNSTVGVERVVLVGTYTGPPNTGVVAGNQVGANSNTAFVSNPIRLTVGSNSITVQLHTIDGPGPSVMHTLIYDPASAPRVTLTPVNTSSMVPFTGRFTVSTQPGETLSLVRVQLDFDGNGSTDLDTTNVAALSFVYRLPALYAIAGTATLDDGDMGTPPVLVPIATSLLAIHPLQPPRTLCAAFGTMRSRLAAQNVSGALNALAPDLRPDFQALWTNLSAQLPTIAGQLGTIVDVLFSADTGELMIARPIQGQPGTSRAYRVHLESSETGVQQISSM